MAAESTDTDLKEIKEDQARMQREIEELRAMAQPIVGKSNKSSSWTWAEPLSDSAGPGSYNVAGEIGKASALSLYSTSPRLTIPLASRRVASQQTLTTPSPCTYTPKVDFSLRNDPRFSFGHRDAKRLGYLEEIASRSPGPVYSPGLPLAAGGKISGTKRDTYSHFVRNAYPSPQDYQLTSAGRTICGRFGKSGRNDYMKEYIPGLERLLKGREGEFYSTLPTVQPHSSANLKAQGHFPLQDASYLNPGVGTYSAALPPSDRGKFSFPKAKRSTHIR